MPGLLYASQDFSQKRKNRDSDTFTLLGGDIKVGKAGSSNLIAYLWMELMGAELCSLGNHEMDVGVKRFAEQLNKIDEMADQYLPVKFKQEKGINPYKTNVKYIASNLEFHKENNPLKKHFAEFMEQIGGKWVNEENNGEIKLLESCIIEKNGHKYGFLGATPMDIGTKIDTLETPKSERGLISSPKTYKDNADLIQKKIKNLQDKGINKIILLSHLGLGPEKYIAENTQGIDIILGGHSHTFIKRAYKFIPQDQKDKKYEDIKASEGEVIKNIKGNPVLLIQAGRNGQKYVTLDVEFDENGVLQTNIIFDNKRDKKKNQLNGLGHISEENIYLGKTKILNKNNNKLKHPLLTELTNNIFVDNPEKVIGILDKEYSPLTDSGKNKENPLACFTADAVKWDAEVNLNLKPDIVLLANNYDFLNEEFPKGEIFNRDILDFLPFRNDFYSYKLNGQEIEKILNWGALTAADNSPWVKPGLIQGSGISYEYELDKDSKNPGGAVYDIRVNGKNLNPDQQYEVFVDSYFLNSISYSNSAKEVQEIFQNKEHDRKILDGLHKKSAIIKYIETVKSPNQKPFKIEADGRIKEKQY